MTDSPQVSTVSWTETSIDGAARTGWLDTPHGRVRTPAFMPVGTRAAVKGVDTDDLAAVGAGIVFGMLPATRASKLDPIEALRHE